MYMHGAPENGTSSVKESHGATSFESTSFSESKSQSKGPRHNTLKADGGRDAFIAGVRDIGTPAAGLECAIFQS